MTAETKPILCGACRIPIEGPADPKDEDVFSCPSCGRADKFKNVIASVRAYATETAGNFLKESIRKSVGRSKFIKATLHPIPKGHHPFVVDMKL